VDNKDEDNEKFLRENWQVTQLLTASYLASNSYDILVALAMPLILGSCLQELSPHIERVIVHTDGVSSNYLVLRKVDYIDRVSDLYLSKGNIFDGVFTKLAVWKLEDYAKVLVLDLDIMPLKQQWCGVEGKKIIQAHCRMTDI